MLVAAALSLSPHEAWPHPQMSPALVNQYLTIVLEPERLRVFAILLYGELPALDERKAMDADRDGHVSAGERRIREDAWRRRMDELLRLDIDGKRARLDGVRAGIQLGASEGVAPAPATVEIHGSYPLQPAEHAIRIEPGPDRPRQGETEIAIEPSFGWRLLESHRGTGTEAGATATARYTFDGPRVAAIEDRSVTFRIASALAAANSDEAAKSARRLRWLGATAAALASVASLAMFLRRRRRTRA